jgi:hypothetical protein
MKQVINRKLYNTETAAMVHEYEHGYDTSDFHYYTEALYRTPKGAYFIAGSGGAMSPYSESLGGGSYGGGSGLRPVDAREAISWLEEHGGTDAILEHFEQKIEQA